MNRMIADIALPLRAALLVGLMAASSGCYHARLTTSGGPLTSSSNGYATDLDASRVVPPPQTLPSDPTTCPVNETYQVRVNSTFGRSLLTVLTLGARSKVGVQWWCAAPTPSGISPLPGTPPPPLAAPAANPSAPTVAATLNPMLWGALQEDLNPNVASKKNNPAKCNSGTMHQVIVPRSYGNALVTVLTVGIWSPIKVEWQCGGEGNSK
jgi:hypothetical protein